MTWIIAILSLIGVIANIQKKAWCFAVWMITNGFWVIHNARIGEFAQSGLFAMYFILSIYGLFTWLKK